MTRETGLNDASSIVWALGEFYFVILINYYLLLYYLYRYGNLHTYLSTLGLETHLCLGPNKYYFKYIFALFSNFYIYKLYFYFYL